MWSSLWAKIKSIYLNNIFCGNCSLIHRKTLVNYSIYLNELDVLAFYGECSRYHGPVANYLEISEYSAKREMAQHIRNVKKAEDDVSCTSLSYYKDRSSAQSLFNSWLFAF